MRFHCFIRSNRFTRSNSLVLLIISTSLFLSGCNVAKKIIGPKSDDKKVTQEQVERQKEQTSLRIAEKRYKAAYRDMKNGNFTSALEKYTELIVQYPFGETTEQAKLDVIFVLHKSGLADEASQATQRFITQYPTHENVDYAYYMKGIIRFPKRQGLLGNALTGKEGNQRNADDDLRASYTAFVDLVTKFPDSDLVDDARQRMIFLHNSLARNEFNVAKFYASRQAYVATINRCKYLIENFSKTPSAIDALVLMQQTYLKMGLPDLAAETQRVLEANGGKVARDDKSEVIKVKKKRWALFSKGPKEPKKKKL